jgi:hypothetical protein
LPRFLAAYPYECSFSASSLRSPRGRTGGSYGAVGGVAGTGAYFGFAGEICILLVFDTFLSTPAPPTTPVSSMIDERELTVFVSRFPDLKLASFFIGLWFRSVSFSNAIE